MATLLLRLAAPLQSWGADSKFETRKTNREPTKSGVIGLLAAALGLRRDDAAGLARLNGLHFAVRADREGSLLVDFHTANREEDRKKGKAPYVTYRHYLQDAVFLVGLESEDTALLQELETALKHPVYPLYLGRRSCPPTLPLCLGIRQGSLLDVLRTEPMQGRKPETGKLRIVADADPATLQKMLADGFPAADTNRAGQIATGFSWKFYAVCDLDTAARFDGLSTVKISVPGKQNTPLSATVEEVTEDKDNGIAKIVLQCQTISAEVLGLGCETVQVDLKTYEGIRIDKAALHIVNGQRGVYVKYGNLQRFLKITTLYENDSYILVPEDGKLGSANEVRLYDEIIVQGTNLEDGKLL